MKCILAMSGIFDAQPLLDNGGVRGIVCLCCFGCSLRKVLKMSDAFDRFDEMAKRTISPWIDHFDEMAESDMGPWIDRFDEMAERTIWPWCDDESHDSDELTAAYFLDRHDDANYDDYNDFYDESMDGDHESGLASAGWGTDEDYGFYGDDY